MATSWNAFLVLVTTGINTPAVAEPPTPISVEFTAPVGCSSLDSFYRGVRARTDRVRLANAREQGVQIRVHISRVGTTIRGELRIGDNQEESETRRVDGVSCNEVVEALSFTAALALDPSASLLSDSDSRIPDEQRLPAAKEPASPNVVLPAPSAAVSPLQLQPPVAAAEPPRRASIKSVDVSAQVLAASYMTHGLMLGPEVGVRLIVPTGRWSLMSAGAQGFFASTELAGSAGAGVFSLTGVGLTLCPLYEPLGAWFEIGVCALARGGWLNASALGVSHPTSIGRTWWVLGAESLTSLKIRGSWRLELAAGLALPLVSREFVTGAPGHALDVGKTPIMAAQANLGLAYRF